jgi:hypothetical protein
VASVSGRRLTLSRTNNQTGSDQLRNECRALATLSLQKSGAYIRARYIR